MFLTTGCSGFHWSNDNWKGKDKAQHFAFSAAMAAAGNAYADRQNMSHRHAAHNLACYFLFRLVQQKSFMIVALKEQVGVGMTLRMTLQELLQVIAYTNPSSNLYS